MQIRVHGRHMDVSDDIRDYATDKIGKVAKIHDRDEMSVEVVLHVEKNPANKNKDVAEVTARMKGVVVRAEEAAPDMFSAIDLVSEKIERQMRKYKTKLVDRRNGKAAGRTAVKTAAGDTELSSGLPDEDLTLESSIVRRKTVEPKPMTHDEAIMQLELLGHDFFVFRDARSSEVSVMYKRMDGNYGVIQTSA